MKVKILEVDSDQLISAEIKGDKKKCPRWLTVGLLILINIFYRKEKRVFVLVKEDTPTIIEGCMIFSNHEIFGPFMDYLEVASHNWGRNGKYKRVAGCLIAYACRLSFKETIGAERGILTFKAFAKDGDAQRYLEDLYRTKYLAVKNPFGYMEIYSDQSEILINEYLNNNKE